MEEIYNQYAKPVYCYLLSISGNSDLAEEMTAETFYRVIKNIGKFRGESTLKTWIFQIAKYVWYQELARKKPSIELDQVDVVSSEETPEEYCLKKDDKLTLYLQMQKLDAITREVIYLRLSGELSFSEIGKILGQTENWARVKFYRGKEQMKKND